MSAASSNQNTGTGTLTLGELLYSDPTITCVPEKDWLALVRAVAAGEEVALRVLFEKSYPVVSVYLMRVTGDRVVTENLILKVFEDLWCEAPVFDREDGPVLGWIMKRARAVALAHAFNTETSRSSSGAVAGLLNDAARSNSGSHGRPEDLRLQAAIEALTMHERAAIEATLLNGLSYAAVAAQQGEPVGAITKRVRSGLSKLRQALQEPGDES